MTAGLAISVVSCLFAILQETGTIHRTLKSWIKPPQTDKDDSVIGGTAHARHATYLCMRSSSAVIEPFMGLLCLFAMILVGEMNLFSPQMVYQTESFVSVGTLNQT